MRTPDEQKVVDYSRNANNLRADFFEAAAKRNPALENEFLELAGATRDLSKLIYVEAGEVDKATTDKIVKRYGEGLGAILNQAAKKPGLMKELQDSQQVLVRELDAFDTRHPELVATRNAMQKSIKP